MAVAQRKAASLREAGYAVVILGERDHPEVAGLEGFAGRDAVVVEDAAGLPLERAARQARRRRGADDADARQPGRAWRPPWRRSPASCSCYNTICDATEKRQSAACELAAEVDVVVVVGGRNSANTARLAQLCRAIEPRTHHIESAAELRPAWFAGARRIGVTAGASTPDEEIEATVRALRALCGAESGARWRGRRSGRRRPGRRRRAPVCARRPHRAPQRRRPQDVLDLEMAAADGAFWLTVLRDGHPLDLVVAPSAVSGTASRSATTASARRRASAATAAASASSTRSRRAAAALSVKDDDYRLSFLHGNFATLTNLAEDDLRASRTCASRRCTCRCTTGTTRPASA